MEMQGFSSLAESTQRILSTVAYFFRCTEFTASSMIVVIMGKHHIVHITSVGIHPLHISGNPFPSMTPFVRQDGHSQFPTSDSIVVTAIQQHGGSIGHDEKHRFSHTRIDKVYLELTLFPSLPRFPNDGVHLAPCPCFLPRSQPSCSSSNGCSF